MISLKCSNTTSAKVEKQLRENEEFKEKARSMGNIELISSMIFSKFDLKNMFYAIMASLCLSDEWKEPIQKTYADTLFFALCANSDPKSRCSITNIIQASTLFKESENDYKNVEMFDENSTMRFESFEPKFPGIFPGTKLEFKIPVRFFTNRKEKTIKRTLGLQKFFKVLINGVDYQIPRSFLAKFFTSSLDAKGNIGIVVDKEEKISSKFECNPNVLMELLNYIGFIKNKRINSAFEMPEAILFIDDGKLTCVPNKNGSFVFKHELWEDIAEKKVLLPRVEYLVVNTGSSNYIILSK